MKITRKNTFQLVAHENDGSLLQVLQELVDGDKVRNQPYIVFPNKAVLNAINGFKWPIEFDDDAKKIAAIVKLNGDIRAENIARIKAQYGKKITFDYDCKGIYAPLEHQKIMYNMMIYSDCCAPLADPGTCKTGPYLWAIDTRKQRGEVKKALVITLSDLKENVLEEMKKQVPHMSGVTLDSKAQAEKVLQKKYKVAAKNIDYDVYIMNYESAFSFLEMFDDDYFQMIICDEAHRIGNPSSRQTKVIKEKFENAKYKYIITGSLHANNVSSFFMPFRFLGADTVPISSFNGWQRRYMYSVDPDAYVWVPVPGAREAVQEIVGKISVQFKKEDCLDLPGVIYQKRYGYMAPEQAKIYDAMKSDLITTIKNMCKQCNKKGCDGQCADEISTKSALTLMGKLHQIASGFYINTRFLADEKTGALVNMSNVITLPENPKMRLLLDSINQIPSDKKVIIWTHWTHAVKMILAELEEAFGKEVGILTCFGNQDAYESVVEFKKSNNRFIIANPVKMGVGQNIQFSCYQIFYSSSYSYIQRDQAIGRQDRQGQTEKVTVIDLIMKGTVDEIIQRCLDDKKDLAITLSALARVV